MDVKLKSITIKKLVITSVCLFFISLAFNNKVSASTVESDYTFTVDLHEDFSADISLLANIKNNDQNNIVSAYQLDLPFPDVDLGVNPVRLNGNAIDTSFDKSGDYTNVTANFGTQIIKPKDSANLEMDFKVKNLIHLKDNTFQLFVPGVTSEFDISSMKFLIIYPKSFGDPLFTSSYKYTLNEKDSERNVIDIDTKQSLFFIWGKEVLVNVSSNFKLENKKNNPVETLVSLIPEYSFQKVNYSEVKGGKYALTDKDNNVFSLISLQGNESSEINFTAQVKLTGDESNMTYPPKYGWNLDLNAVEGQKIYSEINKSPDLLEKLKNLNDYLVKKLNPYRDETMDFTRMNDIWKRLEGNSNFNSFEYCYIVVASAEYLGLQARIEYGYVITPEVNLLNLGSPHVWCTVKVDGKDIMMDPYMEDILGISYFAQKPIDRITFGIWHPSQTYNTMLGLIADLRSSEKVAFSDLKDFKSNDGDVTMSLSLPEKVFSGEYFPGQISVDNESDKLLPIQKLKMDNDEITPVIEYGELKIGLLPKQVNEINLNNLRERDFILNGTYPVKISIEAGSDSIKNVEAEKNIQYEPDTKILILISMAIAITLLILIFVLVKILRRRK